MRTTPIAIMSFFAAIWWALGCTLAGGVPTAVAAIGAAISAALIYAAVKADRAHAKPPMTSAETRRINRLVGWASTIEGLAIFAAVNLLNWFDLGEYQLNAIAVIVGLHFIPLSRLPQAKFYNVTAACLVTLGVATCPLAHGARELITGCAAAILLWLTCATVLPRATDAHITP